MWDYSTPNSPQLLSTAVTQFYTQTSFVMLDDFSPSNLINANLHAEVAPSPDNDYASDLQRNYRLDYEQATPITVTYGTTVTVPALMRSDTLLRLFEFNLTAGDNVLIRVAAPITLNLALATPTQPLAKTGAALSRNQTDFSFGPSGYITRNHSYGAAPISGKYALALINEGRPAACTPGVGGSLGRCATDGVWVYAPQIEIIACHAGSIPTVKFPNKCQPLLLPDASVTPSQTHSIPLETGGSLTIYSEGGFIDTSATQWCTTNEGAGAPIIDRGVSNHYAFVAQGSLCRNGGVITVTTDSAIGLAVPVPNPNPSRHARHVSARLHLWRHRPVARADWLSRRLDHAGQQRRTTAHVAHVKTNPALRSFLGRGNDAHLRSHQYGLHAIHRLRSSTRPDLN